MTELDLIPLDRTKPAKISFIHGVEIKDGGRPAFVVASGTAKYEKRGDQFVESGSMPGRTAVELTGETHGGDHGLYETADGTWLPAPGLVIPELKKDRAKFAERGRKWISVSIDKQVLVAYEGERPVYGALVSTGRGGMSDPSETTATIRGTFLIRAKHVSGTMDGDEASDDSFDLRDVPYIQYFHEGYALHAAYWHDDFGRTRSHGCVNLAPADAAWLFEWTDPPVPAEWHGAVSPQGGTLVYIHK
jgi:lipoprotein-anchoring transpeptidase ErfK/SrfK